MDDTIPRAEHEEFRRHMETEYKRLADENNRQNHRIEELEETVRQIGTLTTSVEKLAVSIESMAKEQERQGKRLEQIEGRDGEKWRTMLSHIGTAILGAVLTIVLAKIGL